MKAVEEQLCDKNYLLLQLPRRVSYTLRISVPSDVQAPASMPSLSVRAAGGRETVSLRC